MKMMAAIYARYSSENQRPESIEDQISSCRKLAVERGYSVSEEHIYFDKAASGVRKDRPGLDALMAESDTGYFGVVLVDDLSRLARSNFLMLSLMAELRFNGISVVSVADGLDSEDEESNLGIQIRGIFNELQLRDLRKKTLRGQIGQKERGFSVGERTFGYKSIPVGDIRMDKKGRPRPEGYRPVIEPREANIVLRIFQDFAQGISQTGIVQRLNMEDIPGRLRTSKGWSSGTVSRILRNEKYIGRWVWNRTESRRDPKTGRRRRFPKPEAEWIIRHEAALRIVPQSLWDTVQLRIAETSRTWPGGKGKRGFETQKGGRVEHYPTHLLSGSMICGACGAAIAQVSGKSGGYYGCLAASKGACENRLLVRRTLCERLILTFLWDKLSPPENLQYVIKRVEEEIASCQSSLPDILRMKTTELEAEERRISNFIEFIAEGRGSQALAEALSVSEQRVQTLRAEVEQLKRTKRRAFKTPSSVWIQERVSELQELLERRTQRSALILRNLLGKIRLEPTRSDLGRSYYLAISTLNVLPLLDGDLDADAVQEGSNTLRWWRRRESNPRPRIFSSRYLHAYPEVCFSSGKTLSGGFLSRPAR